MYSFRILFWVALLTGALFLPASLYAQTNETNETDVAIPPTQVAVDAREIFLEGAWFFSYGMGYGGFTSLFYGLGYSRDPFRTSDTFLHGLSATLGLDYFFREFFNIGMDFTLGGNLNRRVSVGGEQSDGGDTGILLLLTGLRGLVHYPFARADLYGGISLVFGLTRQTFTRDDTSRTEVDLLWVFNWIFRLGSRFPITERSGIYLEASFPFPWITLGGYFQIK